jgi:hypothetical protein
MRSINVIVLTVRAQTHTKAHMKKINLILFPVTAEAHTTKDHAVN